VTSAHIDTFARDRLPPRHLQPEYRFDLPELEFAAQLNCATELLDEAVARGWGARPCIVFPGENLSYLDLLTRSNRIARVLVEDMGLVPGNRVLLRATNNPMLVACWFAVMKAGGIAVTTMPLLRAKELQALIAKAEITHALCDHRLRQDLDDAAGTGGPLREIRYFNGGGTAGLESASAGKSATFDNVLTAADDTCIIAFTSGTTGVPKGTMHFHRDVMAACRCWPKHILRSRADDIFIGTPSLAFTFGLGGLLLFPMSVGARVVLLESAAPENLVAAIETYQATILFAAPTTYRVLAKGHDVLLPGSLKKSVSAGEPLTVGTRALWKKATGLELIDGIGCTEMFHIFISADEQCARAGATGKAVPGYVACVMDDDGRPLPAGQVGRLAVKGPTGCRYLADDRQKQYVIDGWNYTGDAYWIDADGYFHFQSRTDDMILSAGYNIAAPEVEDALLAHEKVAECAVVGVADAARGQIVKALIVLRAGHEPGPERVKELQDFVKKTIAPYKYPRLVEFRSELPRTASGKLQRFRLKDTKGESD